MHRLLAALILLAAATTAVASGYQQPPDNILAVMRSPLPPTPVVSPNGQATLLVEWEEYPSIERVSMPFLRLAGLRVETRNHSRHDTPGGYGITRCARQITIVRTADAARMPVALPAGACADTPVWSADGKRFAFANTARDSVELWVGDGKTGATRRVPHLRLNPMLGRPLQWMPDQQSLVVKAVPPRLGPPPSEPTRPEGPSVQQSDGGKGQSSTYETRDTLRNTHDEALFDYYGSTQVALVDATSLAVRPLGRPAIMFSAHPSPDGRYLLVSRIHRPYSYLVTYERFPLDTEVWALAGRTVAKVTPIASQPLAERVPIHGVPTGPREIDWRANAPATLVWAEALDGGDWNVRVPHRDKLMMQAAPFDQPALEVVRTEQRMEELDFGERADTALLQEYDHNRHWSRTFLLNVDDPTAKPRLVWDLSSDEKYAHPGRPVHRQLSNGSYVMRQDGNTIYLAGQGASPQGSRPFLDKFDMATLRAERLFRSDAAAYERFVAFAGKGASRFLTWHESTADAPNLMLRTVGAKQEATTGEALYASQVTAITTMPDPTPAVRAIRKRLVTYKRADGLDLSFTLYTPPGYVEGTRVPTILYAYPLDYADPSRAGQVSTSQATFTRLRNYRLLLMAGYAIIDNAAFPIVGDPKKAYDTYLEQLVADAKAAVDEAVRLGVADPDRIGVTGHSHGALMTVNLLAHSDLFRAGVATSGAYNKTLTPFGFQSERRSVWEAPEVYTKASPFFFADKLKTPLLLVHGDDDANPGTTPMQSQKLYEAVRGNGGTVRLVMLPHEPHWYAARESNEKLLREMVDWFDKYVKNAPAREQ
ncbi:MAG: prolyl oligopeptidase family serine peptidase [Ramlibacter sp.]